MVRGGGKPNPAMAAMPWREWPRRLGALPQKRKTASWLRSKWIKPNTSLARATTHAKASSPRINIRASRPIRDSMPPCSPPSRCGLAIAQYKLMSTRRPTLTAPARGGLETYGRGGRMPAARPNQRMGRTKINLDNKSPIQAV